MDFWMMATLCGTLFGIANYSKLKPTKDDKKILMKTVQASASVLNFTFPKMSIPMYTGAPCANPSRLPQNSGKLRAAESRREKLSLARV